MSEETRYPQASERQQRAQWTGERIKALREYLHLTQRQMADELQVRQQTISEWETGTRTPHRSSQNMIALFAERAGVPYTVASPDWQPDHTADTQQP